MYRDMTDRLLSRSVVLGDGCWYWLGRVEPNGYCRITVRVNGQPRGLWVHRVAYEVFNGVLIPLKWHIDHRCKQPLCINPNHLECVPKRVNEHDRVRKVRGEKGRYGYGPV